MDFYKGRADNFVSLDFTRNFFAFNRILDQHIQIRDAKDIK